MCILAGMKPEFSSVFPSGFQSPFVKTQKCRVTTPVAHRVNGFEGSSLKFHLISDNFLSLGSRTLY